MIITKKQLVEQLSKLVSFKSLSGNFEENAKVLDYVQKIANDKIFTKRFKNGNAEILLLSTNAKKMISPDIGYMVHSDVVAADDKMCVAKVNGNIIKGRGVADMKYSIPLGVALLSKLTKKNPKNIVFTVAITTDEETGGFEGAQHLADKLKFRPKVLIVPDGGAGYIFINKSKGIQRIKLTSTGKATHASTPWKGKNAIVPLCRIVDEMVSRYEKNSVKKNWGITLNVGKIEGGVSVNQVCPKASVEFDFRFPETHTGKKLVDEVKEVVKNTKDGDKIKIESTFHGYTTFTDASLPVVQEFIKVIEKKIGRKMEVRGTNGGSDARHFAPYNIPILMTAPESGGIHEDSEWLNLDSAILFGEALWDFLAD